MTRGGGRWRRLPARWLLPILAIIAGASTASALEVSGFVFHDRDGDGRRGAAEPGLAGVVVSDQVQVTATGPDGSYRLPDSRGYGVVFVSLPEGYDARAFWQRVPEGAGPARLDFPLLARPEAAEVTFIHASDTHLGPASLPRLRRLQEVVAAERPAFVLVTGDLVRDALRVPEAEARSYYELYVQEMARFTAPVWSVPGNHENFGIERHLSKVSPEHPLYGKKMYRHFLGPNYYSFDRGGVHFVGLDTVDVDDLWYYGHVDETQLGWLEGDLAQVPPGKPVVTFNHIPFFSASETIRGYTEEPPAPTLIQVAGTTRFRHTVSNAAAVLAVLRGHPHPLALAGHIHAREKLELELAGTPTRFHQAAAVVGPSRGAGLEMRSGVVLYRLREGQIDDGRFIALDEGGEKRR